MVTPLPDPLSPLDKAVIPLSDPLSSRDKAIILLVGLLPGLALLATMILLPPVGEAVLHFIYANLIEPVLRLLAALLGLSL